jgi:hypothetical protein
VVGAALGFAGMRNGISSVSCSPLSLRPLSVLDWGGKGLPITHPISKRRSRTHTESMREVSFTRVRSVLCAGMAGGKLSPVNTERLNVRGTLCPVALSVQGERAERVIMTVVAYMSATGVEIAPEDENGGIERHGFIDREWSMTDIHDKRSDVEPLMSVDENDTEALTEEIRDILGDASLYFDNGDGHFYINDSVKENGIEYTYCISFSLNGADWHPERDGGISLSE